MQWWLNTHRIREREKSNIFFWLDRDDNSAIWERLYLADGKDDERMSYTRYSLYIVDLVLLTRRIYIKKEKNLHIYASLFLFFFFFSSKHWMRCLSAHPLWIHYDFLLHISFSLFCILFIYINRQEKKKARRLNY